MALKDTWTNKVDGVDDVLAEDINSIAEAVIQNENDIKKLNEEKQTPLTDEQLANIDAVPNKADKTEVANAVKEKVQGQTLAIRDISPLTEELKVKVTGEFAIESAPVFVISDADNIWDEAWYRDIDYRVNSTNYIPVNPDKSYMLYCSSNVDESEYDLFFVTFFDENKEEISGTFFNNAQTIITPLDCYYIKFELSNFYGATYNNDVWIVPASEIVYHPNKDGEIVVNKFDKNFVNIFTKENVTLECEYNKDINAVIGNVEPLELLYEGTTTEEVSTISVTTDLAGNAFDLDELYATVKIETPNNINPNVYFTALGISAYIGVGTLGTTSAVVVASWKRNQYAKAEHYQYGNTLKTSKIVEVPDTIKVDGFRLQLFGNTVFPVGTEVKVWGKKVQ